MKILRSLNKKNFLIIFIILFSFKAYSENQPVDIWNIDKNENEAQIKELDEKKEKEIENFKESDIYKMQNQKKINPIELDVPSRTQKINIYGLYDPEDYDLDINMWMNSNVFFLD